MKSAAPWYATKLRRQVRSQTQFGNEGNVSGGSKPPFVATATPSFGGLGLIAIQERTSHVAHNVHRVILARLVAAYRRIRQTRRHKLILPDTPNSDSLPKKESLHRHHISGRNRPTDHSIRRVQSASGRNDGYPKKMTLNSEHIGGVDPGFSRRQRRFAGRDCVAATGVDGERVISRAICRGRSAR